MKRIHCLLVALLLPLASAPAQNQPAPKPGAPPAKSVTIAPPQDASRNIRFQFDGIPYADVLERFAQMASRPLVADAMKIEGTLTFNDPKPYNYAEALDTLNVILSMKSMMLVEDGNYLRLVPFKELPQLPLRILRGSERAADVRPGEVVTVVLDLKSMDAKEIAQSLTNLLSTAGSVAPLSRGRGLIVTDRMANIHRIRTLIAAVDSESVAERQMKTYTLLHASGAVVADLINRTFGVATAPKRTSFNTNTKALDVLPPDPGDYVTAVYDDASRTLVLFGPNERLQLADQLVARFEDKEGGSGDVRIYTPQLMKAEELAAMIRQAVPGVAGEKETAASAATKARVIADTATGRLIVAAPLAGQADQIEQLINRLDKPVHGTTLRPLRADTVQVTKVFRTRTAEATNVANIFREAFTRRTPSGAAVQTANITVEPRSQSVIITGSPADLQMATDILTQLETGSSTPRPQQTRFIDLGSPSESKRLLPLIEQIYRGQATDALTGSVAHARMLPEPETGRLIVTGSDEHLKMIEGIVKELRVQRPGPMLRRLQIISFKNAKLDTAFTSFTSLVTERMTDKRFEEQPKPSVIQDAANNRVLVTATEEQLREIEQIVAVVDVAPAQQRREMTVMPVRSKSPAEIITLATQLMAQLGEPGSPQTEPKLVPDASGKQIIVLATAKDMPRVREFIQQLDVATTQNIARQFKAVDLHSRTAAELSPLVTQLYAEQIKGLSEPPGGAATLLPDAKNNRIMVSGADAEIARVEAIIRQLDPAGRRPAREETRVVRLKAALAAELATLVEKSLSVQGQPVKVLVDARSNSLVLSGDADAVEAASKIIAQLDTPSDVQPREMRVMELKQGDATVIAGLAMPLVTELLKSQRGPEYSPSVRMIPDAAANRLILSGPRNELLALNTIIEQLDQAPEGAGGAKVIKLNNAVATKIVGVVSNAMLRFDARNQPIRRVSVTADAESNTLVVSGSRTDLKDAETIISRLDNEGVDLTAFEKPRQFKLIEVRSADPDGLAALATRIFTAQTPGRAITNLVSISAEPNGKRIIVLAPDTLLPQIEAVIVTLDSKPDQSQRELAAIELKNARAADLLPSVTRIYSEQTAGRAGKAASLYPDASGSRIMVFGTQDQVAAVRQIVTSLEAQPPAAREVKVFDLGRLAEANRVLPLLKQLYQDKFASNPTAGAADAQMISDGKTGRVVVSARADHLKVIEELIAGLQPAATTPAARETKSFEVGNAADVQRLQPLVQQLYTDQWKERGEGDPADAQILSDAVRGRLIVTGRPEHLKQIEAILAQLGAANAKPLGGASRDTRIFDLTTASAVELAVTVKTLYTEQSKARFGNVAPDTLITADAGGNRLIVVGDTNELAVIEGIVTKLDKTSAQSSTARVFRIKSADPAKVAEILTTALVRYDAFGKPQKRATVTADAKTRTLVVTGDPKELQGISLIIEQLDSSLAEQSERRMKVLTLKQGAVRDVTAKLRQLFADRVKSQPDLGTSELLLLDDTASNQLILAGSDAQLKAAEQILATLQESAAAAPARELRVFELGQPAELRRVLSLAQNLYQERWKDRDASDPADAQFLTDTNNARLLISGRPAHLKEIESIIAMVRRPAPDLATLETRVFDLVAAQAAELTVTAKSLYDEQLKSRPAPPVSPAMILADVAANRIVLSGASNELNAVETIIRKLDKANAVSGGTRIFKLTNAEPEQVASVLSAALATVTPVGRTIPRVTVGADNRTRLLTVVGEPRDIAAAAKIIEEFEANSTHEPRQMRVFGLSAGLAENTTRNIRAIVLDQLKSRGFATDANVIVLTDDRNPRLLVTATDAQLKAVEEALKQVKDVPEMGPRQLTIIPLTNIIAAPILQVVTQLFATQITNRDSGQRLVVSASPDDRTLLVDGPGHTLTRISQLVRTLDLPQTNSSSVIQTVHLKKSEPVALAEAVTKTIASREAQPLLKRVTVTPVSGANAVLLNGPTDSVQEVLKLIRELDGESAAGGGGDIEVRVYKLKTSDAKEVVPVLEQMIESVLDRRGVRRATPADAGTTTTRRGRVSIAVMPRANSLIVSATPAQFKLIEQLLPTLDAAPERGDRDVHIAWLRKAKAVDVADRLTAVYADRPAGEKPVIEADYQANSITVIAKAADVAQIQDLITRLDDSGKDDSMQVRLRTLGRVPVEQMARMLTNIYPQMHAGQVRIVEKLAPLPVAPKAARPPQGTNTTSAVTNAPGEVIIAVDRDANALILAGPTAELDNIDRILSELQWSGLAGDAELHVFPLKEADPVIVARTLNDLFRSETQARPAEPPRPGEAPRPAVVLPAPKMVVVPEPRTRSIIVRAKATDFLLMKSLIEQLDAAGLSAQLDFRLIALTNAPAEKVAPAVQQMAQQLNLVRPGEALTVTAFPRLKSLLVFARGPMIDQLEKLIRALDQPTEHGEAEVRVFTLQKANAPQLAAVLQSMLRLGATNDLTPEARELQEQVRRLKVTNTNGAAVLLDLTKPIRIMTDPAAAGQNGGNRLLISSTPDNLLALAAVVEMLDKVALTDAAEVAIIPLQHADAASVSQTLTSVFTQGVRLGSGPAGTAQPDGEQGKALVSPLNVAVDARLNTMILSGRRESLVLARRIITDLDKPTGRFLTEVKLFRLKHAAATKLLPLLQAVFAEGAPVAGSEGISTFVTRLRTTMENGRPVTTDQPKARAALVMQADDTMNVLIVAARTDALPLIEEVIKQLDIPDASGLSRVRIYPLQHSDAATVQKIINDLHTGARAGSVRNEDRPNITVDERSNSMVVSGNDKAFAMIEGLLLQLDKALPLELRDIRILPLTSADAVELAATIQKLMDARIARQTTLGRGQAESLRVLIVPESRSNSLLIGGGKDSFDLVQSLVRQLDTAAPALSGRIRLVPLQFADARVISTTLNNLFTQRYAAAKSPDTQRARPVIVPDARVNALLISAAVVDNEMIDDLVKKLDRALDNPALTLSVLPLKHNDAAKVATTMESIFAARLKARALPGAEPSASEQVKIETDGLNNSLIVSANKENLDLITELLTRLDVEPTVAAGVMETFVLKFADAQRVATMLRGLVQQGLYRPGRPLVGGPAPAGGRDALAIAVDPRSNTLFVSASPEHLAIVKEVITRLDTRDLADAGSMKIYRLERARAANLAAVLTQFFTAKRAGDTVALNAQDRSIPVAVIPDPRLNALLVTGGKEAFDILDRIVPQLDAEDVQARQNFRVFQLKQATAVKLQDTLAKLFANRPPRVRGETPDPITVIADAWVNALIVGAVVEDMAMVESLVNRLDAEQAQFGITVQVIPLQKADARRVATTVQGLYREGTQTTGALPIVVSADERVNALVVSAGEADVRRIRAVVEKLDTDQVARVSEIRVMPLKYARAEALSTVLNAALNTKPTPLTEQNPNAQSVLQFITRTLDGRELVTAALKEAVLITPDPRMNSLIVSGPVDYMGLLEQVISRLDNSSPREAKIRVFTLKHANAAQSAQLLMSMFRMTPAGATAGGNVRTIQYTLVKPDGSGASEGASAILGSEEQGALNVSVDPRTNSLLVGGTDHYIALVAQVIETLDTGEAIDRKTELHRLKNSQALDVATSIRAFLDQERQRVTQILGPDAVANASRLLDREVSIVAETNSNTILLSASPRFFDHVRNLVEELDRSQPQVLIQVLLAEVALDNTKDLGISWNYNKGIGGGRTIGTGTDFAGVPPALLTTFGGYSGLLTGRDLNFLVKAMEDDGRLEVLSRPQVLTADNRPATINIGQRVPLITDSRVTERGDTINSFRYENVGVNLQVTPRIAPDGFVKLEVGTTNSSLSSTSVEINQNATVPIINERRASTTVSVPDGQTVVIGGLISSSDDIRRKKVPLLGDIPYLGAVFRSSKKKTERRELLIMLTPQVLGGADDEAARSALDGSIRRQLDRSTIKEMKKPDALQKGLLDPLFPAPKQDKPETKP